MPKSLLRTVLTAAALLATAGVARAQQPAGVEAVSFDEAVRRAIENNYDVLQAAQAILNAEALLQQANTVFRPTLNGTVQTTILDSGRGFDNQIVQPQTQTAFGAAASYPVLAASRWAARTQAQDRVGISRINAEEVRRQVAIATAEAYLEIIAQRRQIEVALRAVETSIALEDYARQRLEGGVGSKLNHLRAAQQTSSDRVLLEVAQLNVRLAQEALGVLLVAGAPVDAAAEPAFEVPTVPTGQDWLMQRTDIRLFSAEVSAADRVVRDSWKDWVPEGNFVFQPQYLTPAGLFQPSRTWQAVFQFGIPVYDGGERRSLKRQRQAALETTRLQLSDREQRAQSEVRAAQASIASTERALANARLAAEQANEVVRITDIAFRAGATTNIEVVDAQQRARNNEIAAAEAEDRVRRARLDLLVALGRFPG